MVLVADFTASQGQVDHNTPAGVSFITTTQNVLEIAAATVAATVVGLSFIVIVIVVTTTAAVAAAAYRISKVSYQRQLR